MAEGTAIKKLRLEIMEEMKQGEDRKRKGIGIERYMSSRARRRPSSVVRNCLFP